MEAIKTLKEADKIAKELGLVRGKGTYNGGAFWKRPGESAIITRERLAELAGLVESDEWAPYPRPARAPRRSGPQGARRATHAGRAFAARRSPGAG